MMTPRLSANDLRIGIQLARRAFADAGQAALVFPTTSSSSARRNQVWAWAASARFRRPAISTATVAPDRATRTPGVHRCEVRITLIR